MDQVKPRSRGQHGFTLLELLLAITIFAVVISLVYGAYNITFTIIHNSQSFAEYGTRARTALERLSGDLESFYLGSGGFFKGESETAGAFRADKLSFTSTAHLLFDRNQLPVGYAVITYTVEEQEETGLLNLYRADIPFRPGAAAIDERGFLLCDDLKEVAFTYYDEDGNDTDNWDSEEQKNNGKLAAPTMVTLRIAFADPDTEDENVFFTTGVAIPQ